MCDESDTLFLLTLAALTAVLNDLSSVDAYKIKNMAIKNFLTEL